MVNGEFTASRQPKLPVAIPQPPSASRELRTASRQPPAAGRQPPYGTIAIGACQKAALLLAGSMTVTWQS